MITAEDRGRSGERGLFRGCCLGIVLLLVLVGLLAFGVDRATAAPDLGPPPAGTSHGTSQQSIAVALAVQLVAELVAQEHAVVTLSERDLTVIAGERNPHPDRFRELQARVRNGRVAVSAVTSFGPLNVTVVTYLALALDRSGTVPRITTHTDAVDVGAVRLPGWLESRFAGNSAPTVSLDQFFNGMTAVKPVLASLAQNVECIAVAPDGVRIGVHRPGASEDTSVCGG